ncbi:MAG: YfhO family protein [Acidobacteriota bacterium]|nr:YfhO family protein [Acidobacteriota bacterium]
MSKLKKLKAEAFALLTIVGVFVVYFWQGIFGGYYFVSGDALVYSYPMRKVAWEMVRQGTLPLWTPHILSGYPLLSMAQLGIGYPLTWFYLVMPGHVAEHIYVLAPYLLAPIFLFAYLREIGISRLAGLLGALSFTYAGFMVSGLGQTAMFTNAVMWMPLMLIAMERARTRSFIRCLIGAGLAYAMAVLTGLGQGFLYAGLIALTYGLFLSLIADDKLFSWQRWKPFFVSVGGVGLAACLAAFQIAETMQAQRLSIRRTLTYEIFNGGSFAPKQFWQSLINPIYHHNYEATAYVPLLAVLFAIVAIVAACFSPTNHRRTFFWLLIAVLSLLLMMGDHTPLYRLAFRIPVINLFRIPWRHAYEWTLAVSVLAAFGWDAAAGFLKQLTDTRRVRWIGVALIVLTVAAGIVLIKLANKPVDAGESFWPVGLTESALLKSKLAYTALLAAAVWFGLKMAESRWRLALLVAVIFMACYWEQRLMGLNWWMPQNKTVVSFNSVSPPSEFLKKFPPQENRIYTSLGPGFSVDLLRHEPHNLAARQGFHNAAGYEPLMTKRYSQAFGAGWSFDTPSFSAPLDPQMLSPNWRVLDLLNVRHLVEFNAPATDAITKDGIRFAVAEAKVDMIAGNSRVLTGAPKAVDSLSLVTTLANSVHLEQGRTVGRIILHTADGRTIEREVKAGVDSAEWAYERPEVKATIRHSRPAVFDSQPVDAQNSFQALRFQTKFDLGEKVLVDRVEVKNVDDLASLIIWKATLYDSAGKEAYVLRQRLPEHWRKVYDHDSVTIFENPNALPRVWMVPKARAVTEEDALKAVRGESKEAFNPREIALLEKPPLTKVRLGIDEPFSQAEAKLLKHAPNRLVIETNADKRAALVVSEMNFPGWQATIDGQLADIYTANYLLRGLIVPEGKHIVEMRYTAPAAKFGGILSALALLFVGAALIKTRREN